MKFSQDPLIAAVTRFEEVLSQEPLATTPRTWAIDDALARIEKAIRVHANLLGRVGQPVVDLDRPLLPSPGVDRRKAALRNELARLLRETRTLRHRLQDSQTLSPEATCLAGSEHLVSADLKRLREPARRLAENLEDFNKEEVSFVQESITTDIGTGD